MEILHDTVRDALVQSFIEAFEGEETHQWYTGLLVSLQEVDAETASFSLAEGRPSIAAHTEHLRFSLEVATTRLNGPHEAINWENSWNVRRVDDTSWNSLLHGTQTAYNALLALYRQKPNWDYRDIKLAIDTISHVGYHVGAIRQILRILNDANQTA